MASYACAGARQRIYEILCVAEKNSIAKAVAGILSGGTFETHNTRNKFVKNYKFDFTFPKYGSCHVVMTSVAGHLMELEFPPQYRKWSDVDQLDLFDASCADQVTDNAKSIHANLQSQGRRAQLLFIWTDCDREGEAIGYEIQQCIAAVNPSIVVERAVFNNLDAQHILHAARNPQILDMKQVQAVKARQQLDLKIGAAFTRFQTLLCQSRQQSRSNQAVSNTILSFGPCQWPTLGFVVERFLQRENFVPEPFWWIDMTLNYDRQKFPLQWIRSRIYDRLCCFILYERCVDENLPLKVTDVKKKETRKM